MTTNIQLLRSSIAGKRPAPAPLLDGQVAVNLNTSEPGMYFKLTNGELTKVGPTAISTDGTSPNSSPAGSTGNAVGEQWLDGRTAFNSPVLKVFNGAAWVTSSGFTVDDTTGNFTLLKKITLRTLVANGTGADSYIQMPQGATTDESLIGGEAGMIRFDTSLSAIRYHDGTNWQTLFSGEGGSVDDLTVLNDLTVLGNTVLGNDCATDTLTIESVTTAKCDFTHEADAYIDNAANLRFKSATGGNYLGFSAPTVVPASISWTLPGSDGTANQVLATNGSGQLFWDSIAATGSGVTISDSAPTGPLVGQGDLWWNSATTASSGSNRLYVYYNDGNSSQWVDASPVGQITINTSANEWIWDSTILPTQDNVFNIGSPTARAANIYTGDLHLKNDRGDWTVIEEEDYLSLRNNATGKTFRLVMEEVS